VIPNELSTTVGKVHTSPEYTQMLFVSPPCLLSTKVQYETTIVTLSPAFIAPPLHPEYHMVAVLETKLHSVMVHVCEPSAQMPPPPDAMLE